MATVVGSIIAKLQLNIDNFAANLKNAESQLSNVEKKFEGFDKIGSRVTSVGKSLALGVTAPITGLGAAIVKTTSDFDSSMSNVKAISGATGSDFEKLRDKAKEMGAKTQFSATQAADAMGYMAMAGWKTNDIINGLPGVMNAAAASGEDLATVSDIITDSMTAFGLQANQAGHFADVLASASSNSNTNIGMLGESFKYVAPLAGSLGYSVEDTSMALGLMANAGIKGSQGGTVLRAALTRLVKPTKDVQGMMNKYGIELTNSDGSMKSLSEVMGILRTKLGGLDQATQSNVAATLFGQEAMSGMLAIINTSNSDYDKLSKAINNSDGAAQKMADTMNDNLGGKIKTLKSALEGVAIQLGDILVPIITDVVEWFTKWVNKFGTLSEGTQKFILIVAGIAAALGPTIIGIGNFITAVGKISSAIEKAKLVTSAFKDMQILATAKTKLMTAAQAALNVVMNANPISLVIVAIVALVATFVILWNKCEGFRNFWIGLWNDMKEAAGALWKWLQDTASACIEAVTNLWEGLKNWWSGFWPWLQQAPQQLWDWMVNLFNSAWSSMKAGWEAFKQGFIDLWNSIKDWFNQLWQGICNIFTNALSSVTTTFSQTFSGITQIWEGVKQYFTGAWEVIKNIFGGALLFILDLVTLDFGQMKTDMMNVWNNIKNGFSQIWSGIQNIFQGALTTIKSFWTTSWSLIKSTGEQIWNNIKNFFINTWNSITNTCRNVVNSLKNAWTNSLNNIRNTATQIWDNIKSFLVNIWSNITASARNGWSNFKSAIINIISSTRTSIINTWNNILNWFHQLPGRLRQIGSNMFTSMRNGISSTISGVTSAIRNGIQSAINYLTSLPSQAITWGRHMIEGFISGITGSVGKLIDSVKGVAQNVRNFLGFSIPKMGPLHVYMEWMPHMIEGMTSSLEANQHKLINAAKNVAGDLNTAMTSDVGLAVAGNVSVNSGGNNVSSFVPKDDDSTSVMKQLLSELKSLQDKTSEYNINIENVNADDPKDIRKLAEELEAFKNNNKRF